MLESNWFSTRASFKCFFVTLCGVIRSVLMIFAASETFFKQFCFCLVSLLLDSVYVFVFTFLLPLLIYDRPLVRKEVLNYLICRKIGGFRLEMFVLDHI